MPKGYQLEFTCTSCSQTISFLALDKPLKPLHLNCLHCKKLYVIDDEIFLRQMKKFIDLCNLLIESEEILSQTSIGIDIGNHKVKIPYKLLFTRFNSVLDLKINNQLMQMTFRVSPLSDGLCILK